MEKGHVKKEEIKVKPEEGLAKTEEEKVREPEDGSFWLVVSLLIA